MFYSGFFFYSFASHYFSHTDTVQNLYCTERHPQAALRGRLCDPRTATTPIKAMAAHTHSYTLTRKTRKPDLLHTFLSLSSSSLLSAAPLYWVHSQIQASQLKYQPDFASYDGTKIKQALSTPKKSAVTGKRWGTLSDKQLLV